MPSFVATVTVTMAEHLISKFSSLMINFQSAACGGRMEYSWSPITEACTAMASAIQG